jgi:hypothetical protein
MITKNNHNPNYPNLYEFANNTNGNKNSKLKSQKSKLQVKIQNFNYLVVIASSPDVSGDEAIPC